MPTKRTTHRSTTGTKLYAVRNTKGQFKDIQTYKRAHSLDIKLGSQAEAAAKAAAKPKTVKAAPKPKAVKAVKAVKTVKAVAKKK